MVPPYPVMLETAGEEWLDEWMASGMPRSFIFKNDMSSPWGTRLEEDEIENFNSQTE